SEDQSVDEDVVVRDAMLGVIRPCRILQQDTRLQLGPLFLPNPGKFQLLFAHDTALIVVAPDSTNSRSGACADTHPLHSEYCVEALWPDRHSAQSVFPLGRPGRWRRCPGCGSRPAAPRPAVVAAQGLRSAAVAHRAAG